MRQYAILAGLILITLIATGCGGKGTTTTPVTQVVVTPTGLAMNSGDVAIIVATPEDASNSAVTGNTVTYATSNTALVNVSPTGLVCAGTWDAMFINCNGNNSSGNPVAGNATITASSGGITSAPVPVTVHIKVTSVAVTGPASGTPATGGCTSVTMTAQFTAHACSSTATPHDASGPCAPDAKDITSQAGQFTWGTINPSVASVDQTGLVTAVNPGFTGVFASASNNTSSPLAFKTCLPLEIRLHEQGVPVPTGTVTLAQNQTITLETDMTDENGFTQNSISTIVASNYPAVGTLANLGLTATSFGGAGIMAACAPPVCGNNSLSAPTPVYSNLFSISVAPGSSPAPMVFAASSFTPPAGTPPTLIPIDTSKSPPAVGTAINLPGVPNSMVFAANGSVAFLGTNAGLVGFTPSGNNVTLIDSSILGKVLAVAADGTQVIVSNAASDPQGNIIEPIGPSQRLWVFQQVTGGNSSTQVFVKPAAIAAAINGDGFRSYIATNDGTGHVYVFSPLLSLQTITLPRNNVPPNPPSNVATGAAILPSGPFAYIADQNGLEAVATCNNLKQGTNPTTNTVNLGLVQPIANANAFVAVDSTGVDVETATVRSIFQISPPPPVNLTAANCQPGVTYSNQFLDFGIGPFTASQLLVATNGSRIVVLPVGNPNVLSAVPGGSPSVAAIPLAGGGTQAFSGGMTPDGTTVWVGVAGTNNVDKIDLVGGTDSVQVATSFKKTDGSAAPPDIVAVQPK